jgi:sporulation related protein
MGTIRCAECGRPLAKGASFCGGCGAPYRRLDAASPPEETQVAEGPPTAVRRTDSPRNRGAIAAAIAVLAIGAGGAVAILLAAGGGSSSTTVVHRVETSVGETGESTVVGDTAERPVAAGRYVQAGSFQTVSHAEIERRRLAAHGIDVEVVPSDGEQELYPGFQVLLGGPFGSPAAEAAMLKSLHRDGVPSAFARDLSPTAAAGEPTGVAGSWNGDLEGTNPDDPKLAGLLPVSLTFSASGTTGSLDLVSPRCHVSLSLASTGAHAFAYGTDPACAGTGPLVVRPSGDELMVTMLSPDTDSFALGTLRRG